MSEPEYKTEYLPLSAIRVDDEFNCRGAFTMASIADLAKQIKDYGLLQPVVVGPVEEDGLRLLVAGYRRFAAHRYLKRDKIACVLRDDLTDHKTLMLTNFEENVQRVNLNILEEGNAIQRMLDGGLTIPAIAKRLGKAPAWVEVKVQAIKLPVQLHADILNGRFTQKHVRELYRVMTKESTEDFFSYVRWLKDARDKDVKDTSLKKYQAFKRKEIDAKSRTKTEVYELQKVIAESLGQQCFVAKVLGWVNGHVTGKEIYDKIQDLSARTQSFETTSDMWREVAQLLTADNADAFVIEAIDCLSDGVAEVCPLHS